MSVLVLRRPIQADLFAFQLSAYCGAGSASISTIVVGVVGEFRKRAQFLSFFIKHEFAMYRILTARGGRSETSCGK